MVPGLDVAQMNANTWPMGACGFNAQYNRKLFVMVDRLTVYTPSFDGVLWDTIDPPLEDIEGIDVIRGTGGTDAVINIITKKAAETPGAVVVAGGGTDHRAYLKYFDQNYMVNLAGQSGEDGRHMPPGWVSHG
jgi:iron complex outermembrane recepter protein